MNRVSYIGLVLLMMATQASAQRSNAEKTGCVLSFRVEATDMGIQEETILIPLSNELSRVFRFTRVDVAEGVHIEWRNENPFNKFKHLSANEQLLVDQLAHDAYFKIEVEHRFNDVLGGIIKKGKRHVMRLRVAMFDAHGQRVWYQKKKSSCCIELGVDPEQESLLSNMEPDDFLNLYETVLHRMFGNL